MTDYTHYLEKLINAGDEVTIPHTAFNGYKAPKSTIIHDYGIRKGFSYRTRNKADKSETHVTLKGAVKQKEPDKYRLFKYSIIHAINNDKAISEETIKLYNSIIEGINKIQL